MAFTVKSILLAAVCCSLLSVSRAEESEGGKSVADAKSSEPNKGIPVLVVRQSSSGQKPDFWWMWMENDNMAFLKPMMKPMQDMSSPMTQQMTQMIMDNMPMGQQVYQNLNNMNQQLSSVMNPSQFLGGGSGGGSNPMSGLFGR